MASLFYDDYDSKHVDFVIHMIWFFYSIFSSKYMYLFLKWPFCPLVFSPCGSVMERKKHRCCLGWSAACCWPWLGLAAGQGLGLAVCRGHGWPWLGLGLGLGHPTPPAHFSRRPWWLALREHLQGAALLHPWPVGCVGRGGAMGGERLVAACRGNEASRLGYDTKRQGDESMRTWKYQKGNTVINRKYIYLELQK